MTRHYIFGCPWASGDIQMADTYQCYDWDEVNCKRCLYLRNYSYGRRRRIEHGIKINLRRKNGTKF